MSFHGSYPPDDVQFLIQPIPVTADNVEPLSRTAGGDIDYPTLIASEAPLPPEYVNQFLWALIRNQDRVARDVLRVARVLAAHAGDEVVLVSLVRAGTPVGVLIHRALKLLGKKSMHYSISATRKRGADPSALDQILKSHRAEDLYFIDGWTGKGFIAGELATAVADYNRTRGTEIEPRLVVLADLAGVSYLAASSDDYLIPAAMLRSTVCGLISASMPNPEQQDGSLPDACLYYEFLLPHDQSVFFVSAITVAIRRELNQPTDDASWMWDEDERTRALARSQDFVEDVMRRYGITKTTSVKPGICEAFRALLTRATEMVLLVRDPENDRHDIECLYMLAERKGIEVVIDPTLSYRAAVLLKS